MHTIIDPPVIASPHIRHLSDDFYRRIIRFYKEQPAPAVSHIWDGIIKNIYPDLQAALVDESVERVRQILFEAYDGALLFGVDLGNTLDRKGERWDEVLINTAVSVGVLSAPHQDNILALERLPLVSAVERGVGGKLGVYYGPNGWFGMRVGDEVIPQKIMEDASIYSSISRFARRYIRNVVELGAGTGSMAITFHLLNPRHTYWIVDLPLVSVIQAYVIATTIGEYLVSFEEERIDGGVMICGLRWPPVEADVFFNKDSLPEIGFEQALGYVERMADMMNNGAFFYSINHESSQGNQTRVFDLVRHSNRMRQVWRAPYPHRYGYMTEVFV